MVVTVAAVAAKPVENVIKKGSHLRRTKEKNRGESQKEGRKLF